MSAKGLRCSHYAQADIPGWPSARLFCVNTQRTGHVQKI